MDSEQSRLWRLFVLGRSVTTGVFLLMLLVVIGPLPAVPLRPLLLLAIVQFGTNGLYLYLWQRRELVFLGYLSFSLEVVLTTLLIYALGSDGYVFVLAYLWPIIMGGWLIGRSAILPLTLLSALGYGSLAILGKGGIVPTPRIITTDGTPLALILSLPYLAFPSLLVWLLTREKESDRQQLKARNDELSRVNTALRCLVATSEELLACRDPRAVLALATRELGDLTGDAPVAIHTYAKGMLTFGGQSGFAPAFEREQLQSGLQSWLQEVAQPGATVTTLDEPLAADRAALYTPPGRPRPRGLRHIALRSPHGLEGVLTTATGVASAAHPVEAPILQILSHQLGVALDNAGLFDRLEHERNLLRAILANMAESVLVVDHGGRVLLANQAAASLLGVESEQQIPADLLAALAAGTRGDSPEQRLVVDLVGKTISLSRAQLPASPGTPQSTIYAARDITQEAQVERMKSDFVAYASHELRTPLTTIKMLLRLLLMDVVRGSKSHDYLSIIQTQVDRQARLVSNLLDFTRLEAGRYELTPERVDPRVVVQSAVGVCRPLAEDKGLSLKVADESAPTHLISNGSGLEQVLINLLSNAVKFTDAGGRISITCRRQRAEVLFAVEDSGIGMTAEQLGNIFEKFYTVRNPSKRGEGTGLGLAISAMIVKELGGRIDVASQPGKGSCFTVRLPWCPAEPTAGVGP